MTLEEIRKEIIRDYMSDIGSRCKGTEKARIRASKGGIAAKQKRAARRATLQENGGTSK